MLSVSLWPHSADGGEIIIRKTEFNSGVTLRGFQSAHASHTHGGGARGDRCYHREAWGRGKLCTDVLQCPVLKIGTWIINTRFYFRDLIVSIDMDWVMLSGTDTILLSDLVLVFTIV